MRDSEEIPCETQNEEQYRNGLGQDSFYIWSDKKIPYVIGDGFNQTQKENILDAVQDYNNIFRGCLEWKQRTDEVNFGGLVFETPCRDL